MSTGEGSRETGDRILTPGAKATCQFCADGWSRPDSPPASHLSVLTRGQSDLILDYPEVRIDAHGRIS